MSSATSIPVSSKATTAVAAESAGITDKLFQSNDIEQQQRQVYFSFLESLSPLVGLMLLSAKALTLAATNPEGISSLSFFTFAIANCAG